MVTTLVKIRWSAEALYHLPDLVVAQVTTLHCKSLHLFQAYHQSISDDDIICDRPHYVGLLAGSTITSVRMIFILTYPENSITHYDVSSLLSKKSLLTLPKNF